MHLRGKTIFSLSVIPKIRESLIKNRWRIILAIFITVTIIVFWINNVSSVNSLILENHRLEVKLKDYRSQNEELRQQITQLCSPNRIIEIASVQLGMVANEEAPIVLKH